MLADGGNLHVAGPYVNAKDNGLAVRRESQLHDDI